MSEENWRAIPGWVPYAASDRGRIANLKTKRVLKPDPTNEGHLRVALRRSGQTRKQFVHRLVLMAFVGPPPFPGACGLHTNDVPNDNRLTNLRWGTKTDNAHDAVRNRSARGLMNSGQKLVANDVRRIRARSEAGEGPLSIARSFGVSRTMIRKILDGTSWSHVK